MCLFKITEKFEVPESFGFGYKVFRLSNDGNLTNCYLGSNRMIFPTKTWIKDEYVEVLRSANDVDDVYQTGFHLFTSLDSARLLRTKRSIYLIDKFVIHRVRYKNIVAIGPNELYVPGSAGLCIVAQEIFIEEKGKESA